MHRKLINNYLTELSTIISLLDQEELYLSIQVIKDAWKSGKQIITLGNGGSALTALHFINDWNKSIFLSTGMQFRGRSLIDNIGLMMSYGNDFSYEDIFIEQLKNILSPGDVVIAISGSGNSRNVLKAIDYANSHRAITIGLCGFQGGELKSLAQHKVWVKADDMQYSEDIHSIFGHLVMKALCSEPNTLKT
jgi:D-sedoheptulose 7-phosphate isomerase